MTVVQVAPATRVAIGEEFGLGSGTVSTGRLINALRLLGFDYVFDTNFAVEHICILNDHLRISPPTVINITVHTMTCHMRICA